MRTDAFNFELPSRCIAQRPAARRDAARLLVVGTELEDRGVGELPALLAPGDVLVLNDTRVLPTRLAGRRGEARVEVTLHRRCDSGIWHAFARPACRLRPGDQVAFAPGFAARVLARAGPEVTLCFDADDDGLRAALERHGAMPLPPYIKRPADAADAADYQTVFAAHPGAVAAPTAGLHFTPRIFAGLAEAGIGTVMLTLHVGAGTFVPVSAERVEDHQMTPEWGEIGAGAAQTINAARAAGGRVVAVGSTALRLLETAARPDGSVAPFAGDTALFITPGYAFRAVDLLLSNFHLPRSTLFMLVAAFAGLGRMKRAYAHAIAAGYRFYSYGDCCLLEPEAE